MSNCYMLNNAPAGRNRSASDVSRFRLSSSSSSSSSIVNDNIKITMALSYLWSQLQVNCTADLTRMAAGVYCVPATVVSIALVPHSLAVMRNHD